MTHLQKRIIRKAWKNLQLIQTASNMIEIEALISYSLRDSFGLKDKGMYAIIARENGNTEQFLSHWEKKELAAKSCKNDAMRFLIGFIPRRFQVTAMYKQLLAKVN